MTGPEWDWAEGVTWAGGMAGAWWHDGAAGMTGLWARLDRVARLGLLVRLGRAA